MSVPSTTKSWIVDGKNGFDSLKFEESKQIPKLGDDQVLVRIKGVSLNFRDLIIPKGQYPFPVNFPIVPCSDGAGTIVAIGDHVSKWKTGDEVLTLFNQGHQGGSLDGVSLATGLGGAIDGTLREYAAFSQNGVVRKPNNINFVEASTLSCAGLTAWNGLFGLDSRKLKPGDWVLTQGTGGVSLFALQFAKAAGAKVVSTTGSDDKAGKLKELGADHIINYKTTPEWGAAARAATPNDRGFDHIIEVAGPKSMAQSLGCIAIDGVISIIGFVGGMTKDQPGFLDCLSNICTVRGILVGSRVQLEEMCRAVEANGETLRPIVDQKVFKLAEARDAYEYQMAQKHVGKVCISLE